MRMEIERKFIADKNFVEGFIKALEIPGNKIKQFYTKVGRFEERYREQDGIYYHTIKMATQSNLVRNEDEVRCSKEEYDRCFNKKIGNVVEKTRYKIGADEYVYEFDIYSGDLEGLCICEIEFESEKKANAFKATNLFVREVTDDPRYKNQSLAVNGLPEEQPSV